MNSEQRFFRIHIEVQDIYSDDGRTSQCMYVMYVTGMVKNEMVKNEMAENEMVKNEMVKNEMVKNEMV